LSRSDILVNSLIKSAPQSIVTKIGDYLASGRPIINTGSSPEFRRKVMSDGFGINVPAEDVGALVRAAERLACNSSMRKIMGTKGRAIAEKEFDQGQSYREIVHLVQTLLA
jgi:glycosyltransferase involved in cell wall biosynthesis